MKTAEKIFLISFTAANFLFASEKDTASITIIASGETHGMLYPCDCQHDPGGGLAERASAVRKAAGGSPGALLLLDAGGFAGGGIYDDYTGGRAADSARTAAAVRAMGMLPYDAVAIGDDDLQFGAAWLAKAAAAAGLPLVSANCCLTDKKPLAPAWRVVIKKGVRFAVTAVASPERLVPRNDSCRILPPVSSIRGIWKEMAAASDFRVILSHLGEEGTLALADSFPDCDIMVNGHRKVSPSATAMRGTTLIMQFGYLGKKLSSAEVRVLKGSRPLRVAAGGWLTVGPADGADPAVAGVLAEKATAERRTAADSPEAPRTGT